MKNYHRVIPRDLFNEAKLLKCIGQLCLLIHDGKAPVEMSFIEYGEPFKVELFDEGSLYIDNVGILIKKTAFQFKTTYNSKASYPLFCQHDDVDYPVLTESGNFHEEFIEFAINVSNHETNQGEEG